MISKNEDTLSYKISYFIFEGLGKLIAIVIKLLFNLIWVGIIKASKKSAIFLFAYLFIIGLFAITFIKNRTTYVLIIFLSAILFVSIIATIKEWIQQRPYRKRIIFFNEVFEQVNLVANDGSLPLFLYDENISAYATLYAFQTLIPLNNWYIKKDLLEMYFDAKILDIKQNKKSNRNIDIILQNKELPNMIEFNDTHTIQNKLSIGISYEDIVTIDLAKTPHVLIAGETGSGKSNVMKCLIYQALTQGYIVKLIDFKRGVSFSSFSDCISVIFEYEEAKKVLEELVNETKKRLDLFRNFRVDNLKNYNRIADIALKPIIVFIDELAELLKVRDKELSNSFYDSIESITRLSRCVGIHLIVGIQRPDATIINGQIKNNISGRLCGRFVDPEPSRIMLGNSSASQLQNIKGRFIYKDDKLHEIQCFYYDDSCFDFGSHLTENLVEPDMEEIQVDEEQLDNNLQDEMNDGIKDFDFNFEKIK